MIRAKISVIDDEEDDEDTAVETTHNSPPNPQVRRVAPAVGMKEDTFNLDEGEVVLQWPERLSQASFDDLESWLQLELRKIKRGVVGDESIGATARVKTVLLKGA